ARTVDDARRRGLPRARCRGTLIAAPGTVCYFLCPDPTGAHLNPVSRNLGLWLLLLLMGLLLWSIVTKQQPHERQITFSEFLQAVEDNRVSDVTIQGQYVHGRYKSERGGVGEDFKTFVPKESDLWKTLREKNVATDYKPEDNEPWYLVAIVQWAPMLLLV